jgi:hypothetical protein
MSARATASILLGENWCSVAYRTPYITHLFLFGSTQHDNATSSHENGGGQLPTGKPRPSIYEASTKSVGPRAESNQGESSKKSKPVKKKKLAYRARYWLLSVHGSNNYAFRNWHTTQSSWCIVTFSCCTEVPVLVYPRDGLTPSMPFGWYDRIETIYQNACKSSGQGYSWKEINWRLGREVIRKLAFHTVHLLSHEEEDSSGWTEMRRHINKEPDFGWREEEESTSSISVHMIEYSLYQTLNQTKYILIHDQMNTCIYRRLRLLVMTEHRSHLFPFCANLLITSKLILSQQLCYYDYQYIAVKVS